MDIKDAEIGMIVITKYYNSDDIDNELWSPTRGRPKCGSKPLKAQIIDIIPERNIIKHKFLEGGYITESYAPYVKPDANNSMDGDSEPSALINQ